MCNLLSWFSISISSWCRPPRTGRTNNNCCWDSWCVKYLDVCFELCGLPSWGPTLVSAPWPHWVLQMLHLWSRPGSQFHNLKYAQAFFVVLEEIGVLDFVSKNMPAFLLHLHAYRLVVHWRADRFCIAWVSCEESSLHSVDVVAADKGDQWAYYAFESLVQESWQWKLFDHGRCHKQHLFRGVVGYDNDWNAFDQRKQTFRAKVSKIWLSKAWQHFPIFSVRQGGAASNLKEENQHVKTARCQPT